MSGKKNQDFMQEFQEFEKFFNENVKKFGREDSEKYKNVKKQFQNSYAVMRKFQNESITLDNMAEMTEARKALMDACSSYISANKRAFTGTGQKRLNTIHNILDYCESFEYNQLRETKNWEQYKGKTWGELEPMPMAKVEISSLGKNMGDNASERYIVNHDGKKGLFTPRMTVNDENTTLVNYINGEQRNDYKNILIDNQDLIMNSVSHFQGNNAFQAEVIKNDIRTVDLLKMWDKMPEKTPEQKAEKSKVIGLFLTEEKISAFNRVMDDYKDELGKLPEEDRKDLNKKSRLFDACLEKINNEKEKEPIRNCRDMLRGYAEKEKEITEPLSKKEAAAVKLQRQVYLSMGSAVLKGNQEKYAQTKKLLNNQELMYDVSDQINKAVMAAKPRGGELGALSAGSELSGRNAASSRLAEEFGVGNLLAHSQDMVANINGKKVEGNFMEFVEDGIDMRNCKGKDLERLSKVDLKNTPGLTKDMCNLEVLDYICAQADRHAGNIFLKLDENDRPIGLKGIDNDMCLSDYSLKHPNVPIPMKQGELKDLHFISEDMAKKIQNLKPDDLKRLVGDKISESELEALEGRVRNVQEHIKNNMFLVKDDADWSLKDYDKLIKPENLRGAEKEEEAKTLFEKATHEIEDGLNLENKNRWGVIHQNTNILMEINDAKERYQKELQKAAPEAQKEVPQPEKQSPEAEMNHEKEQSQKKDHIVQNPKFGTKSKEVDPSKTAAKIEDLTEDGTVKLKTYSDGKKIKIYTSSDGQVIKTDTYAADGDKRNRMSLTDIIKNMKDHNEVAQRDGDERDAARKEQKEEIKRQNEKMNPIKDELGNIREPGKQTAEKNNKPKVDKGIQIGAHREKDNSFKEELDRSKEGKKNLRIGAHRENVGMLDNRSKKEALKQDQGMKDNRSKKDALKGGPKK